MAVSGTFIVCTNVAPVGGVSIGARSGFVCPPRTAGFWINGNLPQLSDPATSPTIQQFNALVAQVSKLSVTAGAVDPAIAAQFFGLGFVPVFSLYLFALAWGAIHSAIRHG